MSERDAPMSQSLATVLAHLEPLMTGAFPAAARTRLMEMARDLPPVPCGGFEFSLLAPDGPVDLLQFFLMDPAGATQLRGFIARDCDGQAEPWRWLRDLSGFPGPAEPPRGVRGVWLELDSASHDASDFRPSVFLEFDADEPPPAGAIADALRAMPLAAAEAKRDALARVLAAMPEGAHVSHLGAMFSRPDTPLRINIKRVRSDALAGFAEALGLPVDTRLPAGLIADAYRATLCLDVIDGILPRLGVEFNFTAWPARERGWKWLAERGAGHAVAEAPWAALERWDRVVTPLDADADWPDPLILAEIAGPPELSSVIECGPSHIKITVSPLHPATAKAYVGFRPGWRTQDGAAAPGMDARRPVSGTRAPGVDGAIGGALDFLMAERTQDGLWRDFDFANLASDEWVSFYVGAHIAESGSAAARAAAARAWDLLRERRPAGHGWGYHSLTQPDADSTAWALILAQRLGVEASTVARANLAFLQRHLGRDGAAATYSSDLLAGLNFRLPDTDAHETWHGEHGEVTASAALLGVPEALDNLRCTQAPDGSWEAFWTDERAYSTGLACEALARHGARRDAPILKAAGRWAAGRLEAEAPAFALAWLIRAVLASDHSADRGVSVLAAAVARLAQMQGPDGGWDNSCELRVPVMDQQGGRVVEARATDVHRVFTAASALGALLRARSAGLA